MRTECFPSPNAKTGFWACLLNVFPSWLVAKPSLITRFATEFEDPRRSEENLRRLDEHAAVHAAVRSLDPACRDLLLRLYGVR